MTQAPESKPPCTRFVRNGKIKCPNSRRIEMDASTCNSVDCRYHHPEVCVPGQQTHHLPNREIKCGWPFINNGIAENTCNIRCKACAQIGWAVDPLGKPMDGTESCLWKCNNRESNHYEHVFGVDHKVCSKLIEY